MAKDLGKKRAKEYQMKDLGYKRTASARKLRVTFSNGEVYLIPVQVIADSRDANYADDQEDTLGFIAKGSLGGDELIDWASNNMNFSDLYPYAKRVPEPVTPFNYEEDWADAEKEVSSD